MAEQNTRTRSKPFEGKISEETRAHFSRRPGRIP